MKAYGGNAACARANPVEAVEWMPKSDVSSPWVMPGSGAGEAISAVSSRAAKYFFPAYCLFAQSEYTLSAGSHAAGNSLQTWSIGVPLPALTRTTQPYGGACLLNFPLFAEHYE